LSNSVVADGLSYLYLYKYCNLLINEVCVATGCWSQRAGGPRVRGGLDSEQAAASMGRRPWRQVAPSLNNWLGMAAAASGRRRCQARGATTSPSLLAPAVACWSTSQTGIAEVGDTTSGIGILPPPTTRRARRQPRRGTPRRRHTSLHCLCLAQMARSLEPYSIAFASLKWLGRWNPTVFFNHLCFFYSKFIFYINYHSYFIIFLTTNFSLPRINYHPVNSFQLYNCQRIY
jgi:hypothetical protein